MAFALLALLVISIYSNSFQAAWHLDDYHSIVNNPRIQIADLKPAALWHAMQSYHNQGTYDSDRLYRPIACLTFALNWLAGQERVVGYHIVNVGIHLVTAFTLYWVILLLFQSPALKDRFKGAENFIALLAAALWAANPIHTQAITYIVQRMAAMAAMFYLLGIGFYLKGRISQGDRVSRCTWFAGALIWFLVALGSKENAIMWPVAIILIEGVFFQDLSDRLNRRRWTVAILAGLLAVVLAGTAVFGGGQLKTLLDGYANRPFSLSERLLTEFRILLFYLSLIIYPIPQRLSIEHDVGLSTSLLQPWTTLPSLLIVAGLITWSLINIRKRPIISFALLFFFLNHLIESTVLALELIFEHRNYLPSAFLFLPPAVFLHRRMLEFKARKRSIHTLVAGFIILILIGFGIGTHSRNSIWLTEKSLWQDAMAKAPDASRPYHNLAWGHYQKIGDHHSAMVLYTAALNRSSHHRMAQSTTIGNMAGIYYTRRNYTAAVKLWQKALSLAPRNERIRYHLARGLIKTGALDDALTHLDHLIDKRPDHPAYDSLKGYVLLKQGQVEKAITTLKGTPASADSAYPTLVNLGAGQNRQGDYRTASRTLRRALRLSAKHTMALMWLADTYLKYGRKAEADRTINRLLKTLTVNRLNELLARQPEDTFILFPQSEILYGSIARALKQTSTRMAGRVESSQAAFSVSANINHDPF